MEVPSQGWVTPEPGWQPHIRDSCIWAWWRCRNHMGDRWRKWKGASVKVYSSVGESLLVRWSHMRPMLPYVAPAHWPGVMEWERIDGKEEWKSLEAWWAVLTFLYSHAHQKLGEQPNKRCFICFSPKMLVEMCVQVPAEKAPVVTWHRLAWLPTGVNIEMEEVEWNRIEMRMSRLWEKAFISVVTWIKNRIETIQQFMQYSVTKSSWVRNHNFIDV